MNIKTLFVIAACTVPIIGSIIALTYVNSLSPVSLAVAPTTAATPISSATPSSVSSTTESSAAGVLVFLLVFLVYFAPTITAFKITHHRNAPAICVINLSIGLIFMGWIISMVLASGSFIFFGLFAGFGGLTLLGPVFLGWVIAMTWAFTDHRYPEGLNARALKARVAVR
jgi:hypothetical protein